MNRRTTLRLLGGAGAVALTGRISEQVADAASCVALTGAQTEGPYWVDEMLNRVDVRVDPSDGTTRPGVAVNLAIVIQEADGTSCKALAGAQVDIWHCDAAGIYSDKAENNSVGKKFLRGYQITDDSGTARFTTIYPGWYSGRAVHIHVRIRTYNGKTLLDNFTSQIFFDDTLTDTVFAASAPYNQRRARDTRNAVDMVLTGTRNGSITYAAMSATAAGYDAVALIGVNVKTAAVAKPVITGVVNAGSFATGLAPGAWTTIFGQNLAATSQAITSTDTSGGVLPKTLSGVTVQVGSEAAFVEYVSPTQINIQAPDGAGSGALAITVTNSAGTSDPVTVAGQPALPGLFASGGYPAGISQAKPGAVIELYGTGFGSTQPAVGAGAVFQGSAPLTNPVSATIGGVAATVVYAGLISTGVNQVNVTVPALADGDYPVLLQTGGLSTQTGVTLKVRSA